MCPKSQSRQEHDSLRNLHCACRENLWKKMRVNEIEIESEIDEYSDGLNDDKNDPLKLPFAELYSPINRFVRYRTVMAVNG